jgi:hypothetical protein
MHMKVLPTTVIRFANLPSLVFPEKNKVRYCLNRIVYAEIKFYLLFYVDVKLELSLEREN